MCALAGARPTHTCPRWAVHPAPIVARKHCCIDVNDGGQREEASHGCRREDPLHATPHVGPLSTENGTKERWDLRPVLRDHREAPELCEQTANKMRAGTEEGRGELGGGGGGRWLSLPPWSGQNSQRRSVAPSAMLCACAPAAPRSVVVIGLDGSGKTSLVELVKDTAGPGVEVGAACGVCLCVCEKACCARNGFPLCKALRAPSDPAQPVRRPAL
jgi:hypothetical protein